MKTCYICKAAKDLCEFSKERRNCDGLRNYCKPCDSARHREKRAADPEKARALDRAKYAANPEPKRRSARARYAETPGKMRSYLRERDLNKKYGITTAQFDWMVAEQHHACAICRKGFVKTGNVDHCHQTGKVRGILCQDCNQGIGHFKDSPILATAAAAYLTKYLRT